MLNLEMLSATPYLDHRNQVLWNEVSAVFSITIQRQAEPNYALSKIRDQVTIYVPPDQPSKASFSHELLHLWMDMKDVSVSGTLSSTFETDPLLKVIFKPELADHLGNCADHYKMLPLYLQMGFGRDTFVKDYNTSKCIEKEVDFIELLYNHSEFDMQQIAADYYLAKFFAIKGCANPVFNYTEQLQRLKNVDVRLFKILDEFWERLHEFDINTADAVLNSYRRFTYPFTESLKDHISAKFAI